jgi:hypothetical protein
MDFDLPRTAAAFVALIVVGAGALIATPQEMIPMANSTILMMVAPSMAVFGLICVAIGVKHGEFRAQSA